MSSRNVAVRNDVYTALVREKRPNESFTKLFVRLLRQKGPVEELNGAWGGSWAASDGRLLETWRFGPGRRGRS